MGNSLAISKQSNTTCKVILFDGSVEVFDKPLTVAELMLEHPQQVVVEFQTAISEKRPIPLPADKKLEMKKLYMMLPIKRTGKPINLSSEEIQHALLLIRSKSFVSNLPKFLPLFARTCSAMSNETQGFFVAPIKKECYVTEFDDGVLERLEAKPEYLSRTLSGKGWRPSLDTIKEKKVEKKVPHWLFVVRRWV